LYKNYSFGYSFYVGPSSTPPGPPGVINDQVVQTIARIFNCPAAPQAKDYSGKYGPLTFSAASGDYGPILGVDYNLAQKQLLGSYNFSSPDMQQNTSPPFPAGYFNPASDFPNLPPHLQGALDPDGKTKLDDITDGTSNTILIAEVAARPVRYIRGQKDGQYTSNSGGGGWGDATTGGFILQGSFADGVTPFGPCVVNCSNDLTLYGFHTGGAQAVFVDGSVHILSDKLNVATIVSLVTRAGGEVIGEDY
jgi:prepilin-type processing-associated H-X9-DG protein